MAFTLATNNGRRTNNAAPAAREESEFDGLWINVGVETALEGTDGEEAKFVRLPRGIAVSDLVDHKVYASTNPDWAEEANIANAVMEAIRQKGLTLEEGEAVTMELSVQLYRRQEQVEQVAASADTKAISAQIFGG